MISFLVAINFIWKHSIPVGNKSVERLFSEKYFKDNILKYYLWAGIWCERYIYYINWYWQRISNWNDEGIDYRLEWMWYWNEYALRNARKLSFNEITVVKCLTEFRYQTCAGISFKYRDLQLCILARTEKITFIWHI